MASQKFKRCREIRLVAKLRLRHLENIRLLGNVNTLV